MQIKRILRFYFHWSEWLTSETQVTAYPNKVVEQGEHSFIAGGSANLYNHFGNQFGISQKIGNSFTSGPSYNITGHTPKKCSTTPQRYSVTYVHSTLIHNNQMLETT